MMMMMMYRVGVVRTDLIIPVSWTECEPNMNVAWKLRRDDCLVTG